MTGNALFFRVGDFPDENECFLELEGVVRMSLAQVLEEWFGKEFCSVKVDMELRLICTRLGY